MKKIALTALLLSLAAPAAFGQMQLDQPTFDGGGRVYLQTSDGDAESEALVEMIMRALDKSRTLTLVPVPEDNAVGVRAPLSMVKDEVGKRVTVTYEVKPAKREVSRIHTTVCASTQLNKCAEAIADRAEQVGRMGF